MPSPRRDISLAEQANVRALLRVLRAKLGGQWQNVARALPVAQSALNDTMCGRTEVSVTIAFRVARLMNVSLYDVINGTALPPGVCKHCGRSQDE
jgi:DNA-binding XRE family transcriptional regulator